MTQSGQGEEPSAQPAHEGIVLPSDGGEPLLPGMTAGPGRPADGPLPAQAPPGGQAWGQPWGPGQQQHAAPPQQNWPASPDQGWAAQQGGGYPAQQQQPQQHQQPHQPQHQQSHQPPQHQHPGGVSAPGAGPLPPEGAPGPSYGGAAGAYGAPGGAGVPMPPQGGGMPLPPAADEGATQYIPPVGAASPIPGGPGQDNATHYLPPVRPAAAADEGATQYLPPVAPGALPPETPGAAGAAGAERPAETTQYLGRARQGGAPGADADATQYIPPVAGGRETPAEFDNLFRSEGADGTRQLPRFQDPQPPQPSYDEPGPDRGRRRTGSRVPVIAACGIAIAVVGIGAGALLAGGGEDDETPAPVSATAPASQSASASPSPSADPAEQQAIELDKLLADSGDSRTAVINAVNDVKSCDNLAQAAKNLRDAAGQRNDLVTKLSGLSVDELPDHAALTTALTKAWKASASADEHYAAWADQVAGQKDKLCKKGQARSTGQTQAGNRESGTATTQKAEAAKLWNAIAKEYGLTERQPTQL
ncbi:hypothetical protein ACWC10_18280 [Streptomyces sp. NPDC001595]|uniref:hypothetical protein n=1 Tax=Streptomyces sp. NPDC001532 TaxID=3154520 RepID=UPI003318CEC2